ncbi:MAG: cache domain-containing protein, partial [Lachnospiraceae bacterium]|nr:cache domain-containing protein [Lachnospiraceae bacterium]
MKMKLRGNSFFWVLLKMNMVPLILLTLVITMFSTLRFVASMNVETKNGLVNLCHTVVTLYDTAYEGDYHIEDEGDVVYMMKGEQLLDGDFSIIDSIKEKTGVDITIFNQDTRVITTIQTSDGVRAIGTKANDTVAEDVLKGGQPHFYSSTMVEGVRYFSYYEPIYASDGSCIGMIFLGKQSEEVEPLLYESNKTTIEFGI